MRQANGKIGMDPASRAVLNPPNKHLMRSWNGYLFIVLGAWRIYPCSLPLLITPAISPSQSVLPVSL